MSSLTNYAEKKLGDHLIGKAAYTMPTTVYLALFTADPGETGSQAAEVTTSSSGYSRQAITSVMSAFDSTSGVSANASTVTFGPALIDWGTITHFAIMDASTAGNMLMYAPLQASRVIQNGDSFQILANQATITIA